MTAAGAITGAELVPLVQGGANVRSTVTDILSASGLDIAGLQQALSQYDVAEWSPNILDGLTSGQADGILLAPLTSPFTTIPEDPTSATALLRGRNVQDQTFAMAGRRGGLYSSVSTNKKVFRRVSGDAAAGGFYFFERFSILVANDEMRAAIGLYASITPAGIGAVMDDFVNAIFLGKDEGDTNLAIIRQGASGGATKTSLGITASSVQGKTIELEFTAAPGGTTVDYRVYIVETAVEITGTVSTGLPATDAGLYPIAWINTGSSSTSVTIGINRVSMWSRN